MITFELFTQTKETDWIGRESSSMYYSLQLGPLSFPAIHGNYVWDALIENGKTELITRCVYEIPGMNALVVTMAIMTTICVNAYKSFLLFDLATGKVTLRKFQNKQSTNSSTKQSTNPSTNQSANPSTKQSTYSSTKQSTYSSTKQSTNPSTKQSTNSSPYLFLQFTEIMPGVCIVFF